MKTTVDIPEDEALKGLTQKVIQNNFAFSLSTDEVYAGRANNPIPLYPGEKTGPIKHIVFISKENALIESNVLKYVK